MKVILTSFALISTLTLSGCAGLMSPFEGFGSALYNAASETVEQMTSPAIQVVQDNTSCNLNEKYNWLLSEGRDVRWVPIDDYFVEDSRGYFAFAGVHDVHCDEVIHIGNETVRFRGGSKTALGEEQFMEMDTFVSRVIGDMFIIDYDER